MQPSHRGGCYVSQYQEAPGAQFDPRAAHQRPRHTGSRGPPPVDVTFTILHTNDFHGQLEPSGSNPGSPRVAQVVNDIRTAVGAANVLLVDSGDQMQGSLLSNLGDGTATGKGIPTIDVYNNMGYNAATFGNHEFDWGQVNLTDRTGEATYPYVTANIVKKGAGECRDGWLGQTGLRRQSVRGD